MSVDALPNMLEAFLPTDRQTDTKALLLCMCTQGNYKCLLYLQLLVTGVVLDTTGYNKMKRGEVRLLDVITQVNQQPVCNLQKSFDDVAQDFANVSLVLDRSISLPSISELISEGQSRLICMDQLFLSDNIAIF